MKKYNNFCITWIENDKKNETCFFCKASAIREYIRLLYAHMDENRDISSLTIYGVTVRDFRLEDITSAVNRFLAN